ncbi:MAG: 2-hydroxychromene-2-carboxylate isomerase [Umezawaea sp.]
MSKNPTFYFSLRSPYSWMAYRDLLAKYPDVAEAVEWVPFFEPDELSTRMLTERGEEFPYSAMSRAKHFYILQDVGRLTKERGLPLTWPVDRDPVWEVPHLGYLVARRAGLGREYVDAVYRTRWELGRDICDPEVIADVAVSLGLDPVAVSTAASDPALREEGVEILLRICKDGVFGVPFFVHRFSRFWGMDRLDEFAAHLRSKLAPACALPASATSVGLGRSSEESHAGGCG